MDKRSSECFLAEFAKFAIKDTLLQDQTNRWNYGNSIAYVRGKKPEVHNQQTKKAVKSKNAKVSKIIQKMESSKVMVNLSRLNLSGKCEYCNKQILRKILCGHHRNLFFCDIDCAKEAVGNMTYSQRKQLKSRVPDNVEQSIVSWIDENCERELQEQGEELVIDPAGEQSILETQDGHCLYDHYVSSLDPLSNLILDSQITSRIFTGCVKKLFGDSVTPYIGKNNNGDSKIYYRGLHVKNSHQESEIKTEEIEVVYDSGFSNMDNFVEEWVRKSYEEDLNSVVELGQACSKFFTCTDKDFRVTPGTLINSFRTVFGPDIGPHQPQSAEGMGMPQHWVLKGIRPITSAVIFSSLVTYNNHNSTHVKVTTCQRNKDTIGNKDSSCLSSNTLQIMNNEVDEVDALTFLEIIDYTEANLNGRSEDRDNCNDLDNDDNTVEYSEAGIYQRNRITDNAIDLNVDDCVNDIVEADIINDNLHEKIINTKDRNVGQNVSNTQNKELLGSIVCQICKISFTDQQSFESHNKEKSCGRLTGRNRNNIKECLGKEDNERREQNEKVRPFTCETCGTNFTDRRYLKIHHKKKRCKKNKIVIDYTETSLNEENEDRNNFINLDYDENALDYTETGFFYAEANVNEESENRDICIDLNNDDNTVNPIETGINKRSQISDNTVHLNVDDYVIDIVGTAICDNDNENTISVETSSEINADSLQNKEILGSFICRMCGNAFTSQQSFESHNNEKSCRKFIVRNRNNIKNSVGKKLNEGIEQHEKVKPFACGTCGTYFTDRRFLKIHHEEKRCQKYRIENGSKTRHEDEEQNSELVTNLQSEEIVEDFTCDVCDITFGEEFYLDKHYKRSKYCRDPRKRIKTKFFQCKFCLKYFVSEKNLDTHKKRFHGNVDYYESSVSSNTNITNRNTNIKVLLQETQSYLEFNDTLNAGISKDSSVKQSSHREIEGNNSVVSNTINTHQREATTKENENTVYQETSDELSLHSQEICTDLMNESNVDGSTVECEHIDSRQRGRGRSRDRGRGRVRGRPRGRPKNLNDTDISLNNTIFVSDCLEINQKQNESCVRKKVALHQSVSERDSTGKNQNSLKHRDMEDINRNEWDNIIFETLIDPLSDGDYESSEEHDPLFIRSVAGSDIEENQSSMKGIDNMNYFEISTGEHSIFICGPNKSSHEEFEGNYNALSKSIESLNDHLSDGDFEISEEHDPLFVRNVAESDMNNCFETNEVITTLSSVSNNVSNVKILDTHKNKIQGNMDDNEYFIDKNTNIINNNTTHKTILEVNRSYLEGIDNLTNFETSNLSNVKKSGEHSIVISGPSKSSHKNKSTNKSTTNKKKKTTISKEKKTNVSKKKKKDPSPRIEKDKDDNELDLHSQETFTNFMNERNIEGIACINDHIDSRQRGKDKGKPLKITSNNDKLNDANLLSHFNVEVIQKPNESCVRKKGALKNSVSEFKSTYENQNRFNHINKKDGNNNELGNTSFENLNNHLSDGDYESSEEHMDNYFKTNKVITTFSKSSNTVSNVKKLDTHIHFFQGNMDDNESFINKNTNIINKNTTNKTILEVNRSSLEGIDDLTNFKISNFSSVKKSGEHSTVISGPSKSSHDELIGNYNTFTKNKNTNKSATTKTKTTVSKKKKNTVSKKMNTTVSKKMKTTISKKKKTTVFQEPSPRIEKDKDDHELVLHTQETCTNSMNERNILIIARTNDHIDSKQRGTDKGRPHEIKSNNDKLNNANFLSHFNVQVIQKQNESFVKKTGALTNSVSEIDSSVKNQNRLKHINKKDVNNNELGNDSFESLNDHLSDGDYESLAEYNPELVRSVAGSDLDNLVETAEVSTTLSNGNNSTSTVKDKKNSVLLTHGKNFECVRCGFNCSWNHELELHMRDQDGQSVPVICEVCGKLFAAASTLEVHRDKFHTTQINETGKRNSNIAQNKEIGERKLIKHCKNCGKSFYEILDFKSHICADTTCQICDKDCFGKNNLNRHLEKVHNIFAQKPKNKICKACGNTSSLSTNIYLCNKQISIDKDLRKIVQIKSNELLCRICDKVYEHLCVLKEHINSLHGQISPGTHCARNSSLKQYGYYMRLSKEDLFECTICDLKYKEINLLKKHILAHYCEPQYCSCKFCNEHINHSNVIESIKSSRLHTKRNKTESSLTNSSMVEQDKIGTTDSSDIQNFDICRNIGNKNKLIKKKNLDKKNLNKKSTDCSKDVSSFNYIGSQTPKYLPPNPCRFGEEARLTIKDLIKSNQKNNTEVGADNNDDLEMEDNAVKDLNCEICSSKCKWNIDLNIHVCQIKYNLLKSSLANIAIYVSENPFACKECNLQFPKMCLLKEHLLSHEHKNLVSNEEQLKTLVKSNSKRNIGIKERNKNSEKINQNKIRNELKKKHKNIKDLQISSIDRFQMNTNSYIVDTQSSNINSHEFVSSNSNESEDEFELFRNSKGKSYKNTKRITDISQNNKFKCDICRNKFSTFTCLKIHHSEEHGNTEYGYEKINFKSKRRLLPDSMINTVKSSAMNANKVETCEEFPFECVQHQCDICYETFDLFLDLKKHFSITHNLENIDEGNLSKKIHEEEFVTVPFKLRKNMEYAADEEQKFKCKLCSTAFDKLIHLQDHMGSHLGPSCCDICGTEYKNESLLHIHKKSCPSSNRKEKKVRNVGGRSTLSSADSSVPLLHYQVKSYLPEAPCRLEEEFSPIMNDVLNNDLSAPITSENFNNTTLTNDGDINKQHGLDSFFCTGCENTFEGQQNFNNHIKSNKNCTEKVLSVRDKYLKSCNSFISLLDELESSSISSMQELPEVASVIPESSQMEFLINNIDSSDSLQMYVSQSSMNQNPRTSLSDFSENTLPSNQITDTLQADISVYSSTSKTIDDTNSSLNLSSIISKSMESAGISEETEVSTNYSYYNCDKCNFKTINLEFLVNHMEKHVSASLSCYQCKTVFASSIKLSEHKDKYHKRQKVKGCQRKRALKMLAKLMVICPDGKSFKCLECKTKFHELSELKVHILDHDDKGKNCECNKCTEIDSFGNNQLDHFDIMSGSSIPVSMSSTITSIPTSVGHITVSSDVPVFSELGQETAISMDIPVFPDVEQETTINKENDDHIEISNILQTGKFVDCSEVNFLVNNCNDYEKLDYGSSMPLFPEEVVNRNKEISISSDDTLSTSSQKSKDKPSNYELEKKSFSKHLCIVCGKNFDYPAELKYHQCKEHPLRQHLERNELTRDTPFGCELCGKAFASVVSLELHVFKHTEGFDDAIEIHQPEIHVSDINNLNSKQRNRDESKITDINTLWNDTEINPSPRISTWRYGEDKMKTESKPKKDLYQDYNIISSKHVCVYCAKVFDRYSYMIRHIRSNKFCREKQEKKIFLDNVSKTSLNSTILQSRNIPVKKKSFKDQFQPSLDDDDKHKNVVVDNSQICMSQNNYHELQTLSIGYDNGNVICVTPESQRTISISNLRYDLDKMEGIIDWDGFSLCENINANESEIKKVENKFDSSITGKLNIVEKYTKSDLPSLKDNPMDAIDQDFSDEDDFERYTDLASINAKAKQESSKQKFVCEVCRSECKLHPDLNIKICQKSYTINKELCTKILIHDANSPFKCLICSVDFNAICSLKDHMLKHEEELTCKLCLKTFLHNELLKSHMDLIHKYRKIKYTRKDIVSSVDKEKSLNNENNSMEINIGSIDQICEAVQDNTNLENMVAENIEYSSNHIASLHENDCSNIAKTFISNDITDVSTQQSKTPISEILENGLLIISQSDTTDDLTSLVETINYHSDEKSDIISSPVNGIDTDDSVGTSIVTKNSKVNAQNSHKPSTESKTIEIDSKGNSVYNDACQSVQSSPQEDAYIVNCPNCQNECNWSSDLELFICDKKFNLTKELRKQILIKPDNQNPYECRICEKDFTYLCLLKYHMGSHSNELKAQYTCECCGEDFELKSHLKSHMLQFHQEDTTQESQESLKKVKEINKVYHTCDICSGAFVTKTHLNHHKKQMHTVIKRIRMSQSWTEAEIIDCYNPAFLELLSQEPDNEENKVHCSTCDIVIIGNMPLVNHVKLFHTIPSDQPFSCHICSVKFKFKESLENHLEVHTLPNMDDVKLFCRDCEMTFKPEYHFMKHMMGHGDKHPFECQVCEKRFRLEAYLVVHQKKCGGREFPCMFCELVFKRERTLNNHMRFHTGEKKYVCDICGKAFMKHDSLWVHKKVHSNERFHCDLCGKVFKKKKALKLHKMEHDGVILFRCIICEYGTNIKGSFETHMLIHKNGKKPSHECKACYKKFMFRSDLIVHTFTHTGETGPTCNVCGKVFADKQTLKYHYMRHFEENKTIGCPKCDSKFFKKKDLNLHIRKHDKEESEKLIADSFNNEAYSPFQFSLRSQNLNFMCGYCGENLNSNKALEQHVLAYHKDKTTLQIALQNTPQKGRNLCWDDEGLEIPISFIDTSLVYGKDLTLSTIDPSIISIPDLFAKENIVSLLDPMTTPSKVVRNSPMKPNTSVKADIKRDYSASSHTPSLDKDPLSDIENNPVTPSYIQKSSNKQIDMNIKKENLEIEKLFSCEKCREGFGSMRKLKIHMLTCNQSFRTPVRSLSTPRWENPTTSLNIEKDISQISVGEFQSLPVWNPQSPLYNENIPHTMVVTFQSPSTNVVSLPGDEMIAEGKEILTHNGGGKFPWDTPKNEQVVVVVNKNTPLAGETITHIQTNPWETPKENLAVVVISKSKGDDGEKSSEDPLDNTIVNVVLCDDDFNSDSKTISDNTETTFTIETNDIFPTLAKPFLGERSAEDQLDNTMVNVLLCDDDFNSDSKTISDNTETTFTIKTTDMLPTSAKSFSGERSAEDKLENTINDVVLDYNDFISDSKTVIDKTETVTSYDSDSTTFTIETTQMLPTLASPFSGGKSAKDQLDNSMNNVVLGDNEFLSDSKTVSDIIETVNSYNSDSTTFTIETTDMLPISITPFPGEKSVEDSIDNTMNNVVLGDDFILDSKTVSDNMETVTSYNSDSTTFTIKTADMLQPSATPFPREKRTEGPLDNNLINVVLGDDFISDSKTINDYTETVTSHNSDSTTFTNKTTDMLPNSATTFPTLRRDQLITTSDTTSLTTFTTFDPISSMISSSSDNSLSFVNSTIAETDFKNFSTASSSTIQDEIKPWKNYYFENRNVEVDTQVEDTNYDSDEHFRPFQKKSKNEYQCEYCNKFYGNKQTFTYHVRIHTGERPYKCPVCFESFISNYRLKVHSYEHTGGKPKDYICPLCGNGFSNRAALKHHYLTHTGEKPFPCSYCNKGFISKSSRDLHEKSHTGEIYGYCKFCHKEFKTKGNLEKHILIHTNEQPLFPCSLCLKKFTCKKSLQTHMLIHTGVKPFACTVCNRSFRVKYSLENHCCGKENNKFPCNICSKKFSSESTLLKHTMVHAATKSFECEECGSKFRQKSSLASHKRLHTGENLKMCSECGKQFATNARLKYHMKSHSDIKPFPCDKCSLKFRSQSHLNKHSVIHSDSKPFSCNVCSKAFRREDNLKQHILTHSGQKPYACEVCQKSYTQKSALITHARIHTEELPYSCTICKRRYSAQSILNVHMANHSRKNLFECRICKRFLSSKQALEKHRQTHATDKVFFCSTCGAEFMNTTELQDHKQLHGEEKEFQCIQCHQIFSRINDLESHLQLGCIIGQYMCDICGQLFNDNNSCNEHMQTHSVKEVGETVVVITNGNRNSINLF